MASVALTKKDPLLILANEAEFNPFISYSENIATHDLHKVLVTPVLSSLNFTNPNKEYGVKFFLVYLAI